MNKTEVACAVIVRNDMVLVTSRAQNVSHAGRWEFPGGKPLAGESVADCVVRRVREELGLDIVVREALAPFEATNRENRCFVMNTFFAEVVNGEIKLENHDRAEWFMPIQLMQLAWPVTNTPIIDEIVERIISRGRII